MRAPAWLSFSAKTFKHMTTTKLLYTSAIHTSEKTHVKNDREKSRAPAGRAAQVLFATTTTTTTTTNTNHKNDTNI